MKELKINTILLGHFSSKFWSYFSVFQLAMNALVD